MSTNQSSHITVNQTTIHLTDSGEGFPLVLIHGFPQNAHGWDHLVPYLSQFYRVIAIDLRGMGESKIETSGLDKRNLALDIKLILDELKISKAVIVGHDMGGLVVQRFALDHPSYTRQLICISTAPIGNAPILFFLNPKQLLISWYIFFFQIPLIPQYVLNSYYDSFLKKAFSHAKNEANYSDRIENMKLHCIPQLTLPRNKAAINLYRTLFKDFLDSNKDKKTVISIPTLWIQGSTDPFIPPLHQINLKRFSHLTIREFKNKGHWLPDLHSEELAKCIIHFIEG